MNYKRYSTQASVDGTAIAAGRRHTEVVYVSSWPAHCCSTAQRRIHHKNGSVEDDGTRVLETMDGHFGQCRNDL